MKLVKRILALVLAAAMMPVPLAFADNDTLEVDVKKGSGISCDGTIDTLAKNVPQSFKITKVKQGEPLITVTVGSDSETFQWKDGDNEKDVGDDNTVTVSVDWAEDSCLATITLEAITIDNQNKETVEVTIDAETGETYNISASSNDSTNVSIGPDKKSVSAGESATITIDVATGYKLTSLYVSYGNYEDTITSSQNTYHGLTIKYNASSTTTIKGPIYADLTVKATAESTVPTYRVTIGVEDHLDLERGNSSQNIAEGGSLDIRVEADSGYMIDSFRIQYGSKYTSWNSGDSSFTLDNQTIRVSESSSSNRVSFTLYDITSAMNIEFYAGYDSDNIPITMNEGTHINIDSDCGDTVSEGDDVVFTIWPTSSSYSVRRITLEIGDDSASADPEDDDYIRVNNRRYDMEMDDDGEVTLYVDNVREPIEISATAYSSGSSSSSTSRPTITINGASYLTITKSISSSRVDKGDDVTFYLTPTSGYTVDQVTLSVGGVSRSAHGDDGEITVLGDTYYMFQDSSGRVTLYVTDIERNIIVTGRAARVDNDSSSSSSSSSSSNNSSSSSSNSSSNSSSSTSSSGQLSLNTSGHSAFLEGYTDNTFRPNAPMTRGEAAQMLFRLCVGQVSTENTGQFADVQSVDWCSGAVCALTNAGIIDRDTYFWPNSSITRAELCNMLYRLSGSPAASATDFSDTRSHRYVSAIRYCYNRGWITGYNDGTFRPDEFIIRAEVATLMVRVLNRSLTSSRTYYVDVPTNYWAYPYICAATIGS